MSRKTGFPPYVLELVLARSGGHCEVIATGCQLMTATYHHRRPRGSGGTRREETNYASNALAVCASCHDRIESRRSWAFENGFLVPQLMNPADEPIWWRCNIRNRRKQFVYLDDFGMIQPLIDPTKENDGRS